MLKEKAVVIKEKLQDSNLDGFTVSGGWLDRWKSVLRIQRTPNFGEVGDVFQETITARIEKLWELTAVCQSKNIWYIDTSGYSFKALHDKLLVEKEQRSRTWQKIETKICHCYFCSCC